MKIKAQSIRVMISLGGQVEYIITSKDLPKAEIDELTQLTANGKELSVEIKPYRARRSLDANAYCWVLCQKLSEKLNCTKEDVYKEAIRKAGQFDFIAVTDKATEQFIKAWQSKGLGWYAEALESKIDGCKKVMVYYGSSVYDSKEMAHLIDYIVSECKEQGIETLPPWEVERLKKEWKS
jgi:hypothetical protein